MDLGTLKKKLEKLEYASEDEIRRDFDLIWTNCKRYNQPGSQVYRAAEKMEKSCNQILAKLPSQSMLRKRNPQDETRDPDDGTLAAKVLLFKKIKELDNTKLRELIQELIRKHPGCIKEVGSGLTRDRQRQLEDQV